jgi:hypothetical protein
MAQRIARCGVFGKDFYYSIQHPIEMKQLHLLLWLCALPLLASAQKTTISGYLRDASSGEPLISANIYDQHSDQGTVTNVFGFYSLTLRSDSVDLNFSYIGYEPVNYIFLLEQDTTLNIDLDGAVQLEEVVVRASRQGERIEERSQMSQMTVPVEQIKMAPVLLGETDVLKTLQLLPGVQSGGEGQTGLYVRGGSPDQNLVLLDGVPVYNTSHLLGIFSIFNADAVKNVTLTKGGFPARYGGRLSSILEINMKEGNLQEWHGEGSIGMISSRLTLEGPIKKDKTSILVSGRRTYADLLFRPLVALANQGAEEEVKINLHFYDLNAKVQHKFNDKHRLFLSAYLGADVFFTDVSDEEDSFGGGIDWGNSISALRWNWQINNKIFANTTLTYSRYQIDVIAEQSSRYEDGTSEAFSANYFSGIEDWAGRVDFDYLPAPGHYIRFGGGITNHTYRPGALSLNVAFDQEKFDTLIGSRNEFSDELFLYLEDDMQLGPLKANVGLHGSGFKVGDQFYTSLQPRIGLNYLLPKDIALKVSFARMTQFINLLTSESFSLPTDLWVPSTERIKPQQSWQAALGIARTFGDGIEISLEGYYKQMHNVISYKEGASFLFGLENDWQDKVTQGDGESYGAELFVQKKFGRTTGWLGYTLSWNYRQFDEINGGQRYPFRYDRRHDLSIVVNHDFNDRISLSGAWVYGTGNAVTLNTFEYPIGYFDFDFGSNFNTIQSGGERNAFRMSDYHRLDLSLRMTKQMKRHQRTWVFGVYNAYFHRNPYFILADRDFVVQPDGSVEDQPVFREVSILPIIPSISYQFKF